MKGEMIGVPPWTSSPEVDGWRTLRVLGLFGSNGYVDLVENWLVCLGGGGVLVVSGLLQMSTGF